MRYVRGRSRVRSLKLSGKNRHKRRSCSEESHYYHLGNSTSGFCSYCRPSLAIRLCNKQRIHMECNDAVNIVVNNNDI
jgi:hypothetical protein